MLGDYPVVVLFHGGGWFRGSPASMVSLAEFLADQGVVVFNSSYRTGTGGYPESFDDVACAIRQAAERAPEFTTRTGPLTVIAHSAGAHLASVAALSGTTFGGDCPVTVVPEIDRFIGLAGPYDPSLYSQVLPAFFHTRFENDPAPWEAGSPYTYLGQNSEMQFLLIHGEEDQLVPPSSSELFAEELEEAGYEVQLELLPGVSHQDTRSPGVIADLLDFD